MNSPPLLESLTTEQFRQRLAGLLDPRESLAPDYLAEQKQRAIDFVACLPEVFGPDLDRMTLWDRIGTALQTAHAKTIGEDYEFFVSRVLEHIQAAPSQVARNQTIQFLLEWLGESSVEARQGWLAYMSTHLYAVLVHARAAWELAKQDRKQEGSANA